VPPEATAVAAREPGFEVNITAAWPPTDGDPDRHRAWVREAWEALRPHGDGVYANFVSDEGQAGVAYAYGPRLERLRALKRRFDPDNVFRMNANIEPAPPAGGTEGARP
jgi:FAD/FMN-containing dehydrogenase